MDQVADLVATARAAGRPLNLADHVALGGGRLAAAWRDAREAAPMLQVAIAAQGDLRARVAATIQLAQLVARPTDDPRVWSAVAATYAWSQGEGSARDATAAGTAARRAGGAGARANSLAEAAAALARVPRAAESKTSDADAELREAIEWLAELFTTAQVRKTVREPTVAQLDRSLRARD